MPSILAFAFQDKILAYTFIVDDNLISETPTVVITNSFASEFFSFNFRSDFLKLNDGISIH